MVSKTISKLKCVLKGHYYSVLGPRVPDKQRCTLDACYTYSICVRCGKLSDSSKIGNHDFGDYKVDTVVACTLIRECNICGVSQKKIQHKGGIDFIKLKKECEYEQVCKGCGAKLGKILRHGSSHEVPSTDPCKQHLVCDQCGKVSGEIYHHKWGMPFDARFPVEPDDYYIAKAVKCNQCGHIKQL